MKLSIKNKLINILGKSNLEFIYHAKNYLIANLFISMLSLLSLPIITRLLLPDEYGVLSIFTTIISFFVVILSLNLPGAIARYYYEKKDDFAEFLGNNIIFIFLYNIVFLSIIYHFKNSLSAFLKIKDDILIIALIIVFFSIIINILMSYLQATQNSKKYIYIFISKGVITLIVSILWMYLLTTQRYYGKIYGQLVMTILFGIFTLYFIIKIANFKFNSSYICYALSFGVPLIPHALSGFILIYFDRIIIQQLTNAYYTGLYSLAYNIGMVMNIVVLSMNKSWVPIFYRELGNEDYTKINKLAYNYSKYIIIIAITMILYSKELIILLADKTYFSSLSIIPIIVLSYVFIFLYTLFANYSFFRKKTLFISIATISVTIINIMLNYKFIPQYGYKIAAYTTLFSYFLLFIFHYFYVKIILKEKHIIKIKKILINYIILVTAIFILMYMIKLYNFNYGITLIVKSVLLTSIIYVMFIKAGLK